MLVAHRPRQHHSADTKRCYRHRRALGPLALGPDFTVKNSHHRPDRIFKGRLDPVVAPGDIARESGLVAQDGHQSVVRWAAAKAESLARGLRLEVGERRLALSVVSHQTIFPPGAGGLPTLKLGVVYRAPLPADLDGTRELRYRDENFAERAGWKDIAPISAGGFSEILVRFPHEETRATPYMAHCHILEHEDSGMMAQFTVP